MFIDKFSDLTSDQQEQLAAVKDETQLAAFVSKHGIALSDQEKQDTLEYIKTGVLPLDDDELDAAAGGSDRWSSASSYAEAKERAEADGRVYGMPTASFTCACNHQYKYAKSKILRTSAYDGDGYYAYGDIKCYKCGKGWSKKNLSRG